MIACTMTSWPKRIGNCAPVMETILAQTVPPDKIYLNLSCEEFPGRDLPQDLVGLVTDGLVEINWVEGENLKTMKKIFPILPFLDDDDIILNLDDDVLYPPDLIEVRLEEWQRYGAPITSSNNPRWHYFEWLGAYCCGAGSLQQARHLKHWDTFCTDEVLHTFNDDETYMCILWLNGYKYHPCSRWPSHAGTGEPRLGKYNSTDPLGKSHGYLRGEACRSVFERRCMQLTGRTLREAFGCWRDT